METALNVSIGAVVAEVQITISVTGPPDKAVELAEAARAAFSALGLNIVPTAAPPPAEAQA